jgi:Rhodanese-related sulfurtransferase
VKEILAGVFNSDDRTVLVSHDELLKLIENDDAVVIDVRPVEEYVATHIKGALSMPLETINEQLANLDKGKEIVAYCRGPHCVLAPQAMEILRRHGFHVRRLVDGLPEWRMADFPVTLGAQP